MKKQEKKDKNRLNYRERFTQKELKNKKNKEKGQRK